MLAKGDCVLFREQVEHLVQAWNSNNPIWLVNYPAG